MSRRRSIPWGAATAIAAAVVVLAGAGGGLLMASTHGAGATSSAVSANARARTAGSVAGATTGAGDGSSSAASPPSSAGGGLPGTATGNRGTPPASTAPASHGAGTTTPTTPPVGTGATPPASGPASGPAPAAPGTYHYRQVGTLPGPAEGTLVVAPASASGTQAWTRLVGGTVKASTSVMLFNAKGAYLVSPGGLAAGAQASCTFPTPVPWPPWPITAGGSVSSHATCTGAVSSLQVAGRVGGTAPLPLDGQSVNTSIVVNTFVLHGTFNGSPLDATLTETDYYAPSLRVPVLTRTHVSGTAIGLPVTTDRTDTLESATPS